MKTCLLLTSTTVLLALLLAFGLATSDAEAADRIIDGDWDLTDPLTTMDNEWVEVRGNVTVRDGAVLNLTDSRLMLNSMDGRLLYLTVEEGGRLEATDSRIHGGRERIKLAFYDDSQLLGCTIDKLHGFGEGFGIWIAGGNVTMTDCVVEDVNGYLFQVDTTLMATNVTTRNIRFGHYNINHYNYTGPVKLTLETCHINGSSDFDLEPRGRGFRVDTDVSDSHSVVVSVRNTTIENLRYCGRFDLFSDHSAEVIKCSISDVTEGFDLEVERSSFRIVDTRIVGIDGVDSDGIWATMDDDADFELTNVSVGQFEDAISIGIPSGSQAKTLRWDDITIWRCYSGITASGSASSSLRLDVHNPNVQASTRWLNYRAGSRCQINLYDDEHLQLQGTAHYSSGEVRAIWNLDVREAVWVDDGWIAKGMVIFEDDESTHVEMVDLENPSKKEVAGWYVKQTEMKYRGHLVPKMAIDGHTFVGRDYDFWNDTTGRVEFLDDQVPFINISLPTDGSRFNVSQVVFQGTQLELGSGIASTEYSLDGGEWTAFEVRPDGTWLLALTGITDGDHELKVRVVDMVNNSLTSPVLSFSVDTVAPVLVTDDIPSIVNTTTVTISGITEPGVMVRINGMLVVVFNDGTFSFEFEQFEGPYQYTIVATDAFGNVNSTTVTVIRDTTPPSLTIVEPLSGTWTNDSHVTVLGHVSPEADLFVNGELVEGHEGTIEHVVELEEGEVHMDITARDAAGNARRTEVVLFVDRTAPALTLLEPSSMDILTRESGMAISGKVDDTTIDVVVINGEENLVVDGTFAKVVTLVEGTNTFDISVMDRAGNGDALTIVVMRDSEPPEGEAVVSSIEGDLLDVDGDTYSPHPVVLVTVIMDEPVVINLPGGPASEPREVHEFEHTLTEGKNTITIEVTDVAGNEAPTILLTVHYDSTPPHIILMEPADGATTKESEVTIRGNAGTDAFSVRVNGRALTLAPGGNFEGTVMLEEGSNLIEVEAWDAVENMESKNLTVVYEPPETDPDGEGISMLLVAAIVVIVVVVVMVIIVMSRRGS